MLSDAAIASVVQARRRRGAAGNYEAAARRELNLLQAVARGFARPRRAVSGSGPVWAPRIFAAVANLINLRAWQKETGLGPADHPLLAEGQPNYEPLPHPGGILRRRPGLRPPSRLTHPEVQDRRPEAEVADIWVMETTKPGRTTSFAPASGHFRGQIAPARSTYRFAEFYLPPCVEVPGIEPGSVQVPSVLLRV